MQRSGVTHRRTFACARAVSAAFPQIAKRRAAREAAEKDMATAVESGTVADIEKFSKRTIVMTKQHQEDCKKLLALMGMPVVTAPCEAEAQCAELAAGGVVWGVASEDMDTLTFAAPNLVRRITASASRNQAPLHFNLAEALKGLGLTQAQFVDMCILCGSDYTKKTIAGVGPKTAHKLVKSEGSMEGVLAKVAADKLPAPEDFNWREARELFLHHEVLPHTEVEAKWGDADEQGCVAQRAQDPRTTRSPTLRRYLIAGSSISSWVRRASMKTACAVP